MGLRVFFLFLEKEGGGFALFLFCQETHFDVFVHAQIDAKLMDTDTITNMPQFFLEEVIERKEEIDDVLGIWNEKMSTMFGCVDERRHKFVRNIEPIVFGGSGGLLLFH